MRIKIDLHIHRYGLIGRYYNPTTLLGDKGGRSIPCITLWKLVKCKKCKNFKEILVRVEEFNNIAARDRYVKYVRDEGYKHVNTVWDDYVKSMNGEK